MIPGVAYYVANQYVPDEPQLKDKVDCVLEMIAMYIHHKHPRTSFEQCLPDMVIVAPANISGQVVVKYYIDNEFLCEFELEKLTKYNSDSWGLCCDLHTRCLDADSNFDYYLDRAIGTLQGQQNMLGIDFAQNTDLTAIGKDWYTHESNS